MGDVEISGDKGEPAGLVFGNIPLHPLSAMAKGEPLFEQSRSLIAYAKAVVEASAALCDSARSHREATAATRRLSRRHTVELLRAIDDATQDLRTLKARIDTARDDALHVRRKG